MRRSYRLPAALLAAALVTTPVLAAAATASDEVAGILDGMAKSGLKACKGLNPRIVQVIADPDFEQLDQARRGLVLYAAVVCAPEKGDQAVKAAQRLASIARQPFAILAAHSVLIDDAQRRDDPVAYTRSLTALVATGVDLPPEWTPRALGWAVPRLRDDPQTQVALLTSLRAIPWTSDDGHHAVGNGWAFILAERLADAGDLTKAGILLETVTETSLLLSAAQERRFEPLWPAMEAAGRFDWTKVAEAELAGHRAELADAPKTLAPVAAIIDSLRALGRYDEALNLGEAYAARLKRGERFTDADEQRAWLLNAHAYTLFDVGRAEEGDRTLREAIGDDRISQRVNRAELLMDHDRAADALTLINQVPAEGSSAYGLMWVDAIRACARQRLGDAAGAAALLPSLRQRWKDNGAALTRALICAGADDEAAALYVRRLADPTERATALAAFRAGRAPPSMTPTSAAFEAHKNAILARPEVLAALRQWGRPLSLPLAGRYWGGDL